MGGLDLSQVAVTAAPVAAPRTVLAREQLLVTGGQLVAGAGNLVYALVMARVLDPAAFTDLVAFLVLYLLLHLPAAGLSAGGALAPGDIAALRRRALTVGGVGAMVLAAAAPAIANLINLPIALPLLLAAAAPAAALLALERGRLYGCGEHPRAAASLVAEPVARIAVGLVLAQTLGATGAAAGIVIGGYAALMFTASRGSDVTGARTERRPQAAVLAFVLLAIVQNQDLLIANHVLSGSQAARFAALSMLGGVAAFATATVPLVLLPRAADQPQALRVALATAAAIGGTAVLAFVIAPGPLVELVFGGRYQSIAPLCAPYLLGMACLGLARVLVADRLARTSGWGMVALVGATLAVQATLLTQATTTTGVAAVTIGSTVALAAATATARVVTLPAPRDLLQRIRAALGSTVGVVAALAVGAVLLRLLVTRGLWVDEAISVRQAHLPFGAMLDELAARDIHPPLHAAMLWLAVRVFGDGELAVRLPSLAAGTLMVPLLYLTGRDLFDRRTGYVAAALGAVSPLAIWYAQEARMYALYMLFALAAVWGQARALQHGRKRDWAIYALATAALLWTQYLAVLQIAGQQALFAAAAWRRRRRGEPIGGLVRGWSIALVLVAVLVLPLVPYFLDQLAAYADRGAGLTALPSQAGAAVSAAPVGLSVYSIIANLLWAVGGYHSDATMAQLAAFWPLGMLAALLALGRRASIATTHLLLVAALPLLVLFAIGLVRQDLFELRYVAGVVPVLILIGARAITALSSDRRRTSVIACVLAVSLLLVALGDQQLNGTNPRLYDFRGALREVAAEADLGDVIVYSPNYLGDVVNYYVPELPSTAARTGSPILKTGRVFLIGSFLDKPEVASGTGDALKMLERDRRLVEEFRRPQVRVWVFR